MKWYWDSKEPSWVASYPRASPGNLTAVFRRSGLRQDRDCGNVLEKTWNHPKLTTKPPWTFLSSLITNLNVLLCMDVQPCVCMRAHSLVGERARNENSRTHDRGKKYVLLFTCLDPQICLPFSVANILGLWFWSTSVLWRLRIVVPINLEIFYVSWRFINKDIWYACLCVCSSFL